jgi:hypothetical protein
LSSVAGDDVWLAGWTPVECGRSRVGTVRLLRLDSRWFWGLRLHLVCTLHGLPLGWALVGAKADERDVLEDLLATTPALALPEGRRRTLIADKAYYGRDFEARLDANGIDLLRPAQSFGPRI